ncbi:hypothetical protein C0993_001918 [Termitomyces sp. T159_Od127]|nr:hypothetical protein C0993_001918 [Termitomyces sp. T159_Od127]
MQSKSTSAAIRPSSKTAMLPPKSSKIGITEDVSGFKRELGPANEIHTRFMVDAENIYERSLYDEELNTRGVD